MVVGVSGEILCYSSSGRPWILVAVSYVQPSRNIVVFPTFLDRLSNRSMACLEVALCLKRSPRVNVDPESLV